MLHNSLLYLRFAQHVAGTLMPIIRSWRLYRYSQHVAHNFGYGHNQSYVPHAVNICIVSSSWCWA